MLHHNCVAWESLGNIWGCVVADWRCDALVEKYQCALSLFWFVKSYEWLSVSVISGKYLKVRFLYMVEMGHYILMLALSVLCGDSFMLPNVIIWGWAFGIRLFIKLKISSFIMAVWFFRMVNLPFHWVIGRFPKSLFNNVNLSASTFSINWCRIENTCILKSESTCFLFG